MLNCIVNSVPWCNVDMVTNESPIFDGDGRTLFSPCVRFDLYTIERKKKWMQATQIDRDEFITGECAHSELFNNEYTNKIQKSCEGDVDILVFVIYAYILYSHQSDINSSMQYISIIVFYWYMRYTSI